MPDDTQWKATASYPDGRRVGWDGNPSHGWVPISTLPPQTKPAAAPSFLSKLRSAAWERPGDIAQERKVMDSGENPALGNVPGSTSGKFPMREGMSEASSLANAGMMMTGNIPQVKGISPLGLPKAAFGMDESMTRLGAGKDIAGLGIVSKVLKPWRDAVQADAQAPLENAVAHIDSKLPTGVADKATIAASAKEIWDKVPTGENPPQPVQELLAPPEGKSAFIDNTAGGADPIGWTARDLQQIRSRIGEYAFGSKGTAMSGVARNAAIKSYALASDALAKAAKDTGADSLWDAGNSRWKTFTRAWDGQWVGDKFRRSPLAEALSGQTGSQIIEPLVGDTAQLSRDLLGQFKKFAPQGGVEALQKGISQYKRYNMMERVSTPNKFDVAAIASTPFHGVVPGMSSFLTGYGLSRGVGIPLVRYLMTRGINPENVRGLSEVEPTAKVPPTGGGGAPSAASPPTAAPPPSAPPAPPTSGPPAPGPTSVPPWAIGPLLKAMREQAQRQEFERIVKRLQGKSDTGVGSIFTP